MSDTPLYGLIGLVLILALVLPSLRRRRRPRAPAGRTGPIPIETLVGLMGDQIAQLQQQLGALHMENQQLRMGMGMGAPPPHHFREDLTAEMARKAEARMREEHEARVRGQAMEIMAVALPYTERELRRAYARRMKIFHPDHGGTEEEFLALQSAYDLLKKYSSENIPTH